MARGPHVLLLHEPGGEEDDNEAKRACGAAGEADHGVLPRLRRPGNRAVRPRARLIFAWFADQKDYLAFLRGQNADAFATTRGYYHPTWNAVLAYDARSTDRSGTAARTPSPGARSCGASRRPSTGLPPRPSSA